MLLIEIVYMPLASDSPIQIKQVFAHPMTVCEALDASGLLAQYPEINNLPVGIFAKLVTRDTYLKSGDRIEIYRPLQYDPKENRRKRAKIKK